MIDHIGGRMIFAMPSPGLAISGFSRRLGLLDAILHVRHLALNVRLIIFLRLF
jgi:hypothetical protein